ncbi:hypothetical protein D3C75_1213550 [compost metagenome]
MNTVEISLDIGGMEHSVSAVAALVINPIAHYHYTIYDYTGSSIVHYSEYKAVYYSYSACIADCRSDHTRLCLNSGLFLNPRPGDGTLV